MKQMVQYAATLLLWAAAIVLWACGVTPWVLVILAALHFTELLFIGFPTGKKYGCSAVTSAVLCMLFGLFWWVPLKKEMAEDDLEESDFIEDGQEPWREEFER